MAKSKKKKKTPSRIKYEQAHPTISFRASKGLYDRLRVAREKERRSNTDIMEIGLGLIEVKIGTEEKIWRKACDKGWEDGANAAEALYAISYPCSNCGKEIVVTTDEEKKAIKGYMHEHGWCHGDCNDPSF
jgi:hypothetical protein